MCLQTIAMSIFCVFAVCGTPTISENVEVSIQSSPRILVGANIENIGFLEESIDVPEEDIILLTLLTLAEAEGECEEGQRLVISTVLNRVDSEYFPNNIREVIYQKNQFSSMWNGRFERVEMDYNIYDLVLDELSNRSNDEVIFFTANQYGRYGTPMFKVENHYFSSYN